jgi:hypothetical protein
VKVVKKNSIFSLHHEIVELCDNRPAFISIDGDHTLYPVITDHVMAGEALKRGGVIASDDYQNWAMIGVAAGVERFLITQNRHRITPFAFTSLKLFSCHHEWHDTYHRGIIEFAEQNLGIPAAKRFIEARDRDGLYTVNLELGEKTCLVL